MTIKRRLLLSLTFAVNYAFCMEPFDPPNSPATEWEFLATGWVRIACPNCHQMRLFPSLEWVSVHLNSLTELEQQKLVQAVTDYTGDIARGRLCPFCGLYTPK